MVDYFKISWEDSPPGQYAYIHCNHLNNSK